MEMVVENIILHFGPKSSTGVQLRWDLMIWWTEASVFDTFRHSFIQVFPFIHFYYYCYYFKINIMFQVIANICSSVSGNIWEKREATHTLIWKAHLAHLCPPITLLLLLNIIQLQLYPHQMTTAVSLFLTADKRIHLCTGLLKQIPTMDVSLFILVIIVSRWRAE